MIGYYVHHHGRGHLARALCIAAHLPAPIAGLSSLPAPAGWPGDWIELDLDLAASGRPRELTANGALHWAPLRHGGLRRRMAQIAEWIRCADPDAIVSDVSVEVASYARLMGVPVIGVAMPGRREDAPHALGYRLSSAILAPWPATARHMEWPARWQDKTHAVGAFSRFDGRERPPATSTTRSCATVTVLCGAGGTQVTPADLQAAAHATPGWRWNALGAEGSWTEDPWELLCASDVVVTHAGQSCLAEVAAARRPAIVIPEPRPFGEQHATARVLERERLAIVRPSWPRPDAWPALLQAALAAGGERWSDWSSGTGAQHAARIIAEVAHGTPLRAA